MTTTARSSAYEQLRRDAQRSGTSAAERAAIRKIMDKHDGMSRTEAIGRMTKRLAKGKAVGGVQPGVRLDEEGKVVGTIGRKGGFRRRKATSEKDARERIAKQREKDGTK